MPSFKTTRQVPYTPEQMFDLVADVERYPEVLPLCTGMRLLRRTAAGDGTEVIVAEMSVGYKAIRERFTSRAVLDRANLQILVGYINGPFRHLENRWLFSPDGSGGSIISFFISYEFRSRTLALLVGAVFERAFRKFTDAFEARAAAVYGRRAKLAPGEAL
jgi:coenzyme Q-binding protein COQ10